MLEDIKKTLWASADKLRANWTPPNTSTWCSASSLSNTSLTFNKQIPACLWFLAKQKKRKGEVLFIDARKLGIMISRVQSELTDEAIERTRQTDAAWRESNHSARSSHSAPSRQCEERSNLVPAYQDIPGFCRSVPLHEIAQHGHVLTPDSFEESELGPVPKGWQLGSVEDLCSTITNGGTPSRSRPVFWDEGSILWFKTGEFHDGFLLNLENAVDRFEPAGNP